jgi:2,3-diaminopropionate biosynthesis protein SbnB
MLIVRHHEVRDILAGREGDVIETVRAAYRLHDEGRTAIPHSTFLRLPSATGEPDPHNRIIGLPAYLGGEMATVGMKWIASFPGNIERDLDRASAVIVLNSPRTGHPEALIEGSMISAARTAAGAAIAAELLACDPNGDGVTFIGCGVINLAILRFLMVVRPGLTRATAFDIDPARAAAFARRCATVAPDVAVTVADHLGQALAAHDLVAIATTASTPYLDRDACRPGGTLLHVSLRDLTAEAILASHNVVDDADHVCREGTSPHLAEQLTGDRRFIDASLGQLLRPGGRLRRDRGKAVVFSPFGLGVFDLAVARLVWDEAVRRGVGVRVDDLLPASGPLTVQNPDEKGRADD